MNLENIFKNVIKINFLFWVILIISAFFLDAESDYESHAIEETLGLWVLIYIVVYMVNLYFLYKFKPIGKTLYLPLIILGLIFSTLIPVVHFTSFYLIIEWVEGVLVGLIIALLYFTDIKDKFIKK